MKLAFQQLNSNSSAALCKLFETESSSRYASLWQDRSPDFFSLYSPYQSEFPLSYGLKDEQGLLASSVLVPIKDSNIRSKDGNLWQLIYDTDCFVSPTLRSKGLGLDLILQRNRQLQQGFDVKTSSMGRLYFGIENQPGFLNQVAQNPGSFEADFTYGDTTVLHDIYPTSSFEEWSFKLREDEHVLRISLAEVERYHWSELMILDQNRLGKVESLYPSVLNGNFKRLLDIDASAELWLFIKQNKIIAGLTLASFAKVRRFRFNKNAISLHLQSHPLSRLNLSHNEELRSLVVGQTWVESKNLGALDLLLKAVAQKCMDERVHNFYMRDYDENRLGLIFSQTYHFPRKLVFWVLDPRNQDRHLLQKIKDRKIRFKMDNHFL